MCMVSILSISPIIIYDQDITIIYDQDITIIIYDQDITKMNVQNIKGRKKSKKSLLFWSQKK